MSTVALIISTYIHPSQKIRSFNSFIFLLKYTQLILILPISLYHVRIGVITQEYNVNNGRTSTGSSLEFLLEFDLKDAKPGEWRTQCVSYDDEKPFAIQFSIDENGVIWGRVVTKPD